MHKSHPSVNNLAVCLLNEFTLNFSDRVCLAQCCDVDIALMSLKTIARTSFQ